MRLFVAIELPSELRRRVGESLRRLESTLPAARWVRSEGQHLTLAFLGETAKSRAALLEGILAPIFASRASFALRLEGCGQFPARGRARVAWIGFGRSRELIDLETGVRRALKRRFAHTAPSRPFRPHLTVARCSPPWPNDASSAWRTAKPAGLGEPFEVSRGVLMESRLGSRGARYSVVESYPLEGTK